jgi:hypothetical protein
MELKLLPRLDRVKEEVLLIGYVSHHIALPAISHIREGYLQLAGIMTVLAAFDHHVPASDRPRRVEELEVVPPILDAAEDKTNHAAGNVPAVEVQGVEDDVPLDVRQAVVDRPRAEAMLCLRGHERRRAQVVLFEAACTLTEEVELQAQVAVRVEVVAAHKTVRIRLVAHDRVDVRDVVAHVDLNRQALGIEGHQRLLKPGETLVETMPSAPISLKKDRS